MQGERQTPFGPVSDIIARNHARKGKLTAFQQVLCREYMLDHNKTEAYRRAGGLAENPGGAAAQQFNRPQVKAEIARLDAEASEDYERRKQAVGLTKDYVVSRLMENVDRAMTAVPVRDKKGDPTGEWQYDGAVANTALGLLGKELGMFREPTREKGGDTFNFNEPNPFGGWTLEELAAWREAHRARLVEGKVVNANGS